MTASPFPLRNLQRRMRTFRSRWTAQRHPRRRRRRRRRRWSLRNTAAQLRGALDVLFAHVLSAARLMSAKSLRDRLEEFKVVQLFCEKDMNAIGRSTVASIVILSSHTPTYAHTRARAQEAYIRASGLWRLAPNCAHSLADYDVDDIVHLVCQGRPPC